MVSLILQLHVENNGIAIFNDVICTHIGWVVPSLYFVNLLFITNTRSTENVARPLK